MISRFAYWLAAGLAAVSASFIWASGVQNQPPPWTEPLAQLVAELSEPGGYFDTDNLVSNEKSYLQVFPHLEQEAGPGGVYIGVGPDQNFSYIARLRPEMAFIIDIRRDNLLLHLLFKALFAQARNRMEYLCLLTGRSLPEDLAAWRDASIERMVSYVETIPPRPGPPARQELREAISSFGLPLSSEELRTIEEFHDTFIRSGLALQFQTHNRPVQSYNPTYRELLTERDSAGEQRSFLASEADFQFVRSLQLQGRIVPVVGDLAGGHALAAIARWMNENDQHLAAFYVSNVEDYLFRDRKFSQYVRNLEVLPRSNKSVIIRAAFGRLAAAHARPGYYTASLAQPVDDFLKAYAAGDYLSYSDLIQSPLPAQP